MKITINQATERDADKIAPLFDLYRQFYQQAADPEVAFNFVADRLANNESTIFYAIDDDNRVLGFTQLFPSFSSVSAKATWILNDLFVVEEARGLGVGKLLLERAEKLAIDTGAKGIELETTVDNVAAQKLYESISYQPSNGFIHYFKLM